MQDMADYLKPSPQEFVVRLVSIDYYMSRPTPGLDECYSQLEGKAIDQVPIIRIFGATPAGQKACVHIHGAFPYLYVPLDMPLPEDPREVDILLKRLVASLEAGSVTNTEKGASVHRQRIFSVQLVRALKFYGYHADEEIFVKFTLYNPMDVARVATLLQSGQVLGQQFQPYESHIPFLLQFKMDFNLFGMGFVRMEEIFFRDPVPIQSLCRRQGWKEAAPMVHHESHLSGESLLQSSQATGSQAQLWNKDTIPTQWTASNLPQGVRLPARQSGCEIEVDTSVEHILNRRELVRTRLEEVGAGEKVVESLVPMWQEEKLRCSGHLPEGPPSPPRTPEPLCKTVEDLRAQYHRIAASQAARASQPQNSPSQDVQSPAVGVRHQDSSSQPVSQRLVMTPAANAMSFDSPLHSWASNEQEANVGATGVAPEAQHNLWGEEMVHDSAGQEMEELMEWMQYVEGHGEELDPLLALAEHAQTQDTPAPTQASQRDLLQRAQSIYMNTVRKENDDILEATEQDNFVSPVSHRQMRMASQLAENEPPGPAGIGRRLEMEYPVEQNYPAPTGIFANTDEFDWAELTADIDRTTREAQEDEIEGQHLLVNPGNQSPDGQQQWQNPQGSPRHGGDNGQVLGYRIPQTDGADDLGHHGLLKTLPIPDASGGKASKRFPSPVLGIISQVDGAGDGQRPQTGAALDDSSRPAAESPPLAADSRQPEADSAHLAAETARPRADSSRAAGNLVQRDSQQQGLNPNLNPEDKGGSSLSPGLSAGQAGGSKDKPRAKRRFRRRPASSQPSGQAALETSGGSKPGFGALSVQPSQSRSRSRRGEHARDTEDEGGVDQELPIGRDLRPEVRQYAPINAPFRAPRRRVADLVAKSKAALQKRSQVSDPETIKDSETETPSSLPQSQNPAVHPPSNLKPYATLNVRAVGSRLKSTSQTSSGGRRQPAGAVLGGRRPATEHPSSKSRGPAAGKPAAGDPLGGGDSAGSDPSGGGDSAAEDPLGGKGVVPTAGKQSPPAQPQDKSSDLDQGGHLLKNTTVQHSLPKSRRHRADVRRTHALSLAARNFLYNKQPPMQQEGFSQAQQKAEGVPQKSQKVTHDQDLEKAAQGGNAKLIQGPPLRSDSPEKARAEPAGGEALASFLTPEDDVIPPSDDIIPESPSPRGHLQAQGRLHPGVQTRGPLEPAQPLDPDPSSQRADDGEEERECPRQDFAPAGVLAGGPRTSSPDFQRSADPRMRGAPRDAAQLTQPQQAARSPDSHPPAGSVRKGSAGPQTAASPGSAGRSAVTSPAQVSPPTTAMEHLQTLPSIPLYHPDLDEVILGSPSVDGEERASPSPQQPLGPQRAAAPQRQPVPQEVDRNTLIPESPSPEWPVNAPRQQPPAPAPGPPRLREGRSPGDVPGRHLPGRPPNAIPLEALQNFTTSPVHAAALNQEQEARPQGLKFIYDSAELSERSGDLEGDLEEAPHDHPRTIADDYALPKEKEEAPEVPPQLELFTEKEAPGDEAPGDVLEGTPNKPAQERQQQRLEGVRSADQEKSSDLAPMSPVEEMMEGPASRGGGSREGKGEVKEVGDIRPKDRVTPSRKGDVPMANRIPESKSPLRRSFGGSGIGEGSNKQLPHQHDNDDAFNSKSKLELPRPVLDSSSPQMPLRLAETSPSLPSQAAPQVEQDSSGKAQLEEGARETVEHRHVEEDNAKGVDGQRQETAPAVPLNNIAQGGQDVGWEIPLKPRIHGVQSQKAAEISPKKDLGSTAELRGPLSQTPIENLKQSSRVQQKSTDKAPPGTGKDRLVMFESPAVLKLRREAPTGGFKRQSLGKIAPARPAQNKSEEATVKLDLNFPGLRTFCMRQKPPTQSQLDGSSVRLDVPAVVAERPHYGDPHDRPAKAPVFSGIQYRLGTSSVSELPPFKAGSAQHTPAMESLHVRHTGVETSKEAGRPKVYLPARSPPTPEAVQKWLETLQAARAAAQASQPASPASFGMNPNTGALLPGDMLSQDSCGGAHESDLLGTPLFQSPPPNPGTAFGARKQSRLATSSQQLPVPQGNQAGSESHSKDQGEFLTPRPIRPVAESAQEEEPVRPSSPKYDERTFFYTTPQVKVPRASAQWDSPAQKGAQGQKAEPSLKRKLAPGIFSTSPFTKKARWVSQITGPSPQHAKTATPVSQAGFKWKIHGKGQQLTMLSLEVHADSRGSLLSDPRYDAVRCILMVVMDDDEVAANLDFTTRVIVFDESGPGSGTSNGLSGAQVEVVRSEKELFDAFAAAVVNLDPDIIMGWEVQQGSLGYLVDRSALVDIPILRNISRTPEMTSIKEKQNDEYGQLHASGLHSTGRIVLNLWRLLRTEIKLPIYTFESCVAALMQLRTPHLPPWFLNACFNAGPSGGRWRTIEYWMRRARLNLGIVEQLDLVGRTGELARAFGIDFFSVLTRGSQYRVESLLVRLAHSQNYLMPSPSREQVGRQPGMECLPLVMEPESKMYSDPVIVLDFQSLYPSQIIAYNLCYCTCLGRPPHAADPSQAHKLGAFSLQIPSGTLTGDLDPSKLVITPNGLAWTPPAARPGVIPRLLWEILQTRIMVKAAMKRHPASAKVLQRVLNARQFGLKLIANVTYGYTSAGFSGRMPMAELADAIVQSGRQTLENTIQMVEGNPEWRARVVYGDTDSLFVLLPGRTKAEAFRIGAEIASMATSKNPKPVTLKMEKVYQPSVLASKKRYVGFMFENPSQTEPIFDAKGIETVRRDACPVVAKMLERSIRVLFSTHDLSLVKSYCLRQWEKILSGRVSLADFVFAKEVRLGTYSGRGPAPPAAIVAAKAIAQDPRAEPRFSERVPYIVVHGPPGARLTDMVVAPRALVESGGKLRINALYYITKQIIPALERALTLVGADPRAWFVGMSKPQRLLPQKRPPNALPIPQQGRSTANAGTIDQYYLSRHCAVCDSLTNAARPLCESCRQQPQLAAAVLTSRAGRLERHHVTLTRICLNCGGGGGRQAVPPAGSIPCDSLDCAIFYERRKTAHELAAASALSEAGLSLLDKE